MDMREKQVIDWIGQNINLLEYTVEDTLIPAMKRIKSNGERVGVVYWDENQKEIIYEKYS